MLRWIILVGSFALWIACLSVVYLHCKPEKIEGGEAASRMALDRMFSENAVDKRFWNIYVDPDELEAVRGMLPGLGAPKLPPTAGHGEPRVKRAWNGLNENDLVKAGRLETRVKNKRTFSLDEETTLNLQLPGTSLFANYVGKAHLTFDNGMENCSMALKFGVPGFELDAVSIGTRDNDELHMTTDIKQNGQILYNGNRIEKIGGNTALNAEMAPFQFNPDVRPGFEWTIVMLDFNLAATGGEAQNTKPLRVKCTGNTTIMLNGSFVRAFAMRSDDGSARAWYSPDGSVLKQAFKLAGVIEVVIVRDDKALPK